MRGIEDEVIDNLIIPDTVSVALRANDYAEPNGLAGFVSYRKGKKLLKEKEFERFRDREPIEIENTAVAGFSLNLNDYWWSEAKAVDPRGFQINITTANLMEILKYSEWAPDKGLSGKFVYSWEGNELRLISTSNPNYKASNEIKTKSRAENIGAKDLVPGVCYKTDTSDELWYIGRLKWKLIGRSDIIRTSDIHTFYCEAKDDSGVVNNARVCGIRCIPGHILVSMPERGKLDSIKIQDITTTFQMCHGEGIIGTPKSIEILEPREEELKRLEDFKKTGQWTNRNGWNERELAVGHQESDTVINTYDLKKDSTSGELILTPSCRYELQPDGKIATQFYSYYTRSSTLLPDLDKTVPMRVDRYCQCKLIFDGGQECKFDMWGRYLSYDPEVVIYEKEED